MRFWPNYILIISCFSLYACFIETEFDLPRHQEAIISIVPNSDLKALKQAYLQSGEEIFTFPNDNDLVVEAFVISSDEAGNFYKTLIIQNLVEERQGFALKINLKAYYTRYEKGRKVYVNVKGLSMTSRNGAYVLGYRLDNKVTEIPESLLGEYIIRTNEWEDVQGLVIKTGDFDDSHLNTFVKFEHYQFKKEDLGKTFAGEAYDSYNAVRSIESCNSSMSLLLSTNIYADFKSALLPDSAFDLEGILIREYSGHLALVLNGPENIDIIDTTRCDPEYFDCISILDNDLAEKSLVFYENFEKIGSTKEVSEAGWLNLNMNYSNGKFVKRSSDNNTFLRISSYASNEMVMEVWLISPPIDLNNSYHEELSFQTRATFNKGKLLTVWISNDYEEDPLLANWKLLEVKISDGTDDGSNKLFSDSGKVDLGCIEGDVRIAFRYLGSDPSPSTTYDLDNILIKGFLH